MNGRIYSVAIMRSRPCDWPSRGGSRSSSQESGQADDFPPHGISGPPCRHIAGRKAAGPMRWIFDCLESRRAVSDRSTVIDAESPERTIGALPDGRARNGGCWAPRSAAQVSLDGRAPIRLQLVVHLRMEVFFGQERAGVHVTAPLPANHGLRAALAAADGRARAGT